MKMRLRSLVTLSLVAGSLVMVSCGDSKKEKEEVAEDKHEMHEHKEDMHEDMAANEATASFSDESVKQAFDQYIAVKDALVQTDAEAAAKAAKELKATLEANKPEIAKIAGNIAASNDVNKQREMFSKLTAEMESVLKGAISSGKIYKQFCPMAFEGKGDYWYSTSEQIRNPYYGDKMLKCGRVDETIM